MKEPSKVGRVSRAEMSWRAGRALQHEEQKAKRDRDREKRGNGETEKRGNGEARQRGETGKAKDETGRRRIGEAGKTVGQSAVGQSAVRKRRIGEKIV